MGADTFICRARGKNADEAFRKAVEQAQYDHGHSGYTGTIAEKNSFVMIKEYKYKPGMVPLEFVQKLIEDGDERIDDKWGPAGCIEAEKGNFIFFGWASS